MAVNRNGNNNGMEQGTQYEEESFNVNNVSSRIRGPLRANTMRDIANDGDGEENYDDEEGEEEEYYDDEPETILDKLKQNPVIIVAVIAVIAVILIIVVLTVTSSKDKEVPDETEVTEDENALSEDELLAEMIALQGANEPEPVEEDTFKYSDADRKAMIAWGLSIEEIEENERNEVDPVNAIKEVRAMMVDNKADVYKALLRNATDNPDEAYHYVLGNSVFGLPIQPEDKNEKQESYYSETELVDFRKIPLQGYQAMIRVAVPNTDYIFYVTIPYVKYLELPDQGNCKMRWEVTEKNGIKMFTNFTLVE